MDELSKLPPATQTGANTFGCLIDGKAFTPSGYNNPYPNYRLDIDPSLDSGGFLLRVYSLDPDFKRRINIGSTIIRNTGIFLITSTSKTSIDIVIPEFNSINFSLLYRDGFLKINRYDLSAGIFSGEFECKIVNPTTNDTVKITHGRFDKKL